MKSDKYIDPPSFDEVDYNGVVYQLNYSTGTASVIMSPDAEGDIFIPVSVSDGSSRTFVVTSIQANAFWNNKGIMTIAFPLDSQVEMIGNNAFAHSTLSKLYLPRKIIYLEKDWCTYADELNEFKVSSKSKTFELINGVLFDKSKTVLIFFP